VVEAVQFSAGLGAGDRQVLTDAAWYVYLFWLPKYFYDVRHFNTKDFGYFGWIPFAAAGVGCLVAAGFRAG